MLIKKYKYLAKINSNRSHDQSKASLSHQTAYYQHQQKIQKPHLQHGLAHSVVMVSGVMSLMLLLLPLLCVDAVGYSYARFTGPVAGPEHKIYVKDANAGNDGKAQHGGSGALRLDYVGKPEYEFAYGVEDADAHILHNRNEVRDGDAVKGVYSLIDPDGALRVVKYTADAVNGFQAEVIRNGVSSMHGQLERAYKHAPPSKVIRHKHERKHKHKHTPKRKRKRKNVYRPGHHPSSKKRTKAANLEQLPKINYKHYKPYNEYPTTSQSPIIYHDNKNYDDFDVDVDEGDRDVSNEGYSDYHEDHPPRYKVYDKPKRGKHGKHYDKGHGHKSNNDLNVYGNKKKKPLLLDDDDDEDDEGEDDEDYYDENDSEELEDYDENTQDVEDSEECEDYYEDM